jgi:protein TonB
MRMAVVYGASLAVHLGLAGGMLAVKPKPRQERVAIAIREVKKPPAKVAEKTPPKPSEPPAPPKAAPRKVAMPAPKAAPAPAAPSVAPAAALAGAVPEFFGLTMGGSSGGNGVAVPAGRAAGEKEEVRRARPKVLEAAAPEGDGCAEEPVKPKPINIVQPTYTDEARAAQLEGKVRVELTVDESGAVTNARVLAGLGQGLDEAALEAARASTFEPGTRCGKAAVTTFTIGMRFSL